MTWLPAGPPAHLIDWVLRIALAEDLGTAGDITSAAVISERSTATGTLVARQKGVVAGLEDSLRTFDLLGPSVCTERLVEDGTAVVKDTVLARITGPTRTILAGERTCLNLLSHLSGIATATRRMVERVADTGAMIVDTRKTTPGLRALEKHAVRAGGGANHRFGLYDAVLIKDNHLAASGDVATVVTAARSAVGHAVKVEVEIDDLDQLESAIEAGADAVLLDNMTVDQLSTAVSIARGRVLLEASGGINESTVVAVAGTGVNLISVGALTHSAPSLDVALDLDPD